MESNDLDRMSSPEVLPESASARGSGCERNVKKWLELKFAEIVQTPSEDFFEELCKRTNCPDFHVELMLKQLHLKMLDAIAKQLMKKKNELVETLADANKELKMKEEKIRKLERQCSSNTDGPVVSQLAVLDVGVPADRICTEDVWRLIFERLSDGKDLKSCSDTCRFFQEIVYSRRAESLFHLVLPFLYQHLDRESILKCRLVCKVWSSGVDGFLEDEHSIRAVDDPNDPAFVEERARVVNYELTNQDECLLRTGNFLENMGHHGRNPLIGRELSVLEVYQWMHEPVPEFRESLSIFLATFGEHIWFFNYKPSAFRPRERRCVAQLLTVDIFQALPNLKKLCIIGPISTNGDQAQLMAIQNRCPPAPKLESLLLYYQDRWGFGTIAGTLVERYHNQIKKLHVDIRQLECTYSPQWNELTELYIENIHKPSQLKNLLQLVAPKLARLELSFPVYRGHGSGLSGNNDADSESDESTNMLELLLGAMNKLCKEANLSVLRIYGSFHFQDISELPNDLWAPSALKTVEIEHLSLRCYNTCYAFLLRFPGLMNLHLFMCEREEENQNRLQRRLIRTDNGDINYTWDFHNIDNNTSNTSINNTELMESILCVRKNLCDNTMEKSRLWKFLPKLKKIKVYGEVVTRTDYENEIKRESREVPFYREELACYVEPEFSWISGKYARENWYRLVPVSQKDDWNSYLCKVRHVGTTHVGECTAPPDITWRGLTGYTTTVGVTVGVAPTDYDILCIPPGSVKWVQWNGRVPPDALNVMIEPRTKRLLPVGKVRLAGEYFALGRIVDGSCFVPHGENEERHTNFDVLVITEIGKLSKGLRHRNGYFVPWNTK